MSNEKLETLKEKIVDENTNDKKLEELKDKIKESSKSNVNKN